VRQGRTFARAFARLLAGCALCTLGGCSDEPRAAKAPVHYDTLAEAINNTDNISIVYTALRNAGLSQVFDGVAAYTILAPSDQAFARLGEAGQELQEPQEQAAMMALLRDHVVPGYLTPGDIARAIAQAPDGEVTMRTLGDHLLTFTSNRGKITVTAENGLSARFSGKALRATNGVAIPLDGMLKRVSAEAQ